MTQAAKSTKPRMRLDFARKAGRDARPVEQAYGFSLAALYAAMDAERKSRGISWAQLTRGMNGSGPSGRGHKLSASTVMATRSGRLAEGDGVLGMLRWLNRTPESFVRGEIHESAAAALPIVPAGKVLRFDTKKLYGAIDAERAKRKISWAQAGEEIGLSVSQLTRLARGGRTAFPFVMWIVRWLQRPAAEFTRAADR